MIGKPYSGKLNVRFDEGELEIEPSHYASSLLYPHTSVVLKENGKKALEELKRALSEKFEILDFRLFGSKARGTSDPESDLDVMIELPESDAQIEAQIDNIIFKINLENDVFLSAVFFGTKELQEGPMTESPLYKVIREKGITI